MKQDPYFVRCIGIPGKIKQDDIVMDTDGVMHIAPDKWIGQKDTIAKLFLCSWKVRVGDKAFYNGHIGILESEEDGSWQLNCKGKIVKVKGDGVVKIIGEVSPGSRHFVEHGDVFEPKDVEIYHAGFVNPGTPPVKTEVRKVKLRCPHCKNFH